MRSVNIVELNQRLGKINLIDVRENYEYNNGHVPTAVNIPLMDLINNREKYLNKEQEYYVVCQSGGRSSQTCSILSELGYNIINVKGGTGTYSLQYKLEEEK